MDVSTMFSLWIVGSIISLLVAAFILELLWNTTIPGTFNVREIGYWEAIKLILICTILFGAPYFNVQSNTVL